MSSRPRATTCRFYERELSPKKLHKMGLAAQPPNVPVVPPSERVAAKPAIREYDPHVGYPPSTKQWYTLVRLDEYGPGASDAELRELEERILSEPDDTSDDDALETLSGASANDEALLEDVEPEHKPHPQHHAAYVKPGGPCDHCGAAGTFRDVCLSLFSCGTVGRVLSRETRREGARGGGRDVPRAPETRPIRASTRLSSATATFADDIPSSSSPSPRNPRNADSPQWRRGPASKPMLCNACGTRYRRTNTLGPSTPVHRAGAVVVPKKRSPPESPSGLNPAKKRCADEGLGADFGRVGTGVRA